MVEFHEALEIIKKSAFLLGKENVPLSEAAGRVMAADVFSDTDMPPFNRAAMDGFACRRTDLGNILTVVETIRAGDVPEKEIGERQCSRIMTGGQVPAGADCVIMVEHTEKVDDRHIRFTGTGTAGNIAFRGEDLKTGNMVLARGIFLKPQHIAVLASAGCPMPLVYRQPVVAVLNTGDEIVEPDVIPHGTMIRNSNGPQLAAQIRMAGGIPDYMGIVGDNPSDTSAALNSAISGSDVVILTGGVSMGDYDYVPAVMKEAGVEICFEKVAVKPGRPTVFGRKGNTFLFGLPGNPVSSFIIFELLVKPMLYMMMGCESMPSGVSLPIAQDYTRKKADRISWVPVTLVEEGVLPLPYHGSGHIHSLAGAWGLMGIEKGVHSYKKGEKVNVRQI